MADGILVNPTQLDLATGIEGVLEIGGQYRILGMPQGFDVSQFVTSPDLNINGTSILKVSGPALAYSFMEGVRQIPVNQPFSIYGAFLDDGVGDMSLALGVRDNFRRLTFLEAYRYPPEPSYRFNAYQLNNPVVSAQTLFNNEGFRIDSDGTRIYMYRHTGGIFSLVWSFPIPDDIIYWTFCYGLMAPSNSFYAVYCRIDDSIIPITTDNTEIEFRGSVIVFSETPFRKIDKTHYGINGVRLPSPGIGRASVFLSVPDTEFTKEVPLAVTALYIRPSDRDCGTYAITGSTIQFVTNGGNGGDFTATDGTILPNFQWQAPFATGIVTFRYTVGDVFATCLLNIVNKLNVDGVNDEGFAPDLAQGEEAQYVANCPNAVFSCPAYPNIITTSGHIIAPTDAQDDVFGEKNLTIQVQGCFQTYTFKVHVQAMYPIPKFGGAVPTKWKSPLVPDYLANSVQMTGGTSQVKNRNPVGISVWEVQYQGLWYQNEGTCSCPSEQHTANCPTSLSTAKRLDDFYKLVRYTKYFSLLDYQTGMLYKYIRLTNFQFDHSSLFRTEQTRQLQMRQEGTMLFE